MRELKFHEKKLLRKVDLLNWKDDANIREIKTIKRYHLPNRDEYHKYNRLCGSIRKFVYRLSLLPAQDPLRAKMQAAVLAKCYEMGLLNSAAKLSDIDNNLHVAAFCKRRLAVVMCLNLKMAQTVSSAVKLVEQGHVRVGVDVITDPAYLVTRNMEDFVTWVDTSKVKRTVMTYNDELDDYDLL